MQELLKTMYNIDAKTDIFDANDPNAPLPRADLREPAFRKYEAFIAAACKGSIVLNPLEGQTSTTFQARIRDAILGYKRYKYVSKLIPINYPLHQLKVIPLNNGQVRINNFMQDQANGAFASAVSSVKQPIIPEVTNREAWLQFVQDKVENGFDAPFIFRYYTDEDRQFIIEVYHKLSSGMSVRFNTAAKTAECFTCFHSSELKNYPPEDVFQ